MGEGQNPLAISGPHPRSPGGTRESLIREGRGWPPSLLQKVNPIGVGVVERRGEFLIPNSAIERALPSRKAVVRQGQQVFYSAERAIPSPLHGPGPWSLTPPLVPSRLCLEGAQSLDG